VRRREIRLLRAGGGVCGRAALEVDRAVLYERDPIGRRPEGVLHLQVGHAQLGLHRIHDLHAKVGAEADWGRVRKALPSSVSASRRVVRLSKLVSSFSSSRLNARLMPDTVWPGCSAAAVTEPVSATVRKASSSSSVPLIVDFQSTVLCG
jgi:hypothetical protein